jgi:hypothetical protein
MLTERSQAVRFGLFPSLTVTFSGNVTRDNFVVFSGGTMRRTVGVLVGLCAASAMLTAPAHATNIGNEGCTPGYWKNHTDAWEETGPASPNTPLTFDPKSDAIPPFAPSGDDLDGSGVSDTFLEALYFKGGPGLVGAERNLFRAAVASWLNASSEGVGFPLRRKDFVPEVNAAIASGDRQTMLDLAAELDALNNLGCPL